MSSTTLIICSGIHDLQLTHNLLNELKNDFPTLSYLIFPTNQFPAYSPYHLYQFLQKNCPNFQQTPLIFIAFSAGVVSAIITANFLHLFYHNVKALIAFDGWGIPLVASFPIHHISHDYFTHWTVNLLNCGKLNFYADPVVNHLEVWGKVNQVNGYKIESLKLGNDIITPIILKDFIKELLQNYLFGS